LKCVPENAENAKEKGEEDGGISSSKKQN